ncbi:MAG: hypothetical protein IJK18_06750 [Clostridia bacterium]|nr:hypothetical protein [Clostridia bacterium]
MKLIKIVLVLIILVFIFQLVFIPTISLADGVGDIVKQGDKFVTDGNILIDQEKLNKGQSIIFNILLAVGVILTVIVGGYLGIQFMMASAEDKAKIKEAMIPYVLGCIVIYGAFAIWKIVITVLDSIA